MATAVSVSGALMDHTYPAYANHQEKITEAEAVRRIVDMMGRTPLCPNRVDPARGPFDSMGNVRGNWFHYSAGFSIDEPSPEAMRTLRKAWHAHKRGRLYRIAVLIHRVADRSRREAGDLVFTHEKHTRHSAVQAITAKAHLRIKSLEPYTKGTPIPAYGGN